MEWNLFIPQKSIFATQRVEFLANLPEIFLIDIFADSHFKNSLFLSIKAILVLKVQVQLIVLLFFPIFTYSQVCSQILCAYDPLSSSSGFLRNFTDVKNQLRQDRLTWYNDGKSSEFYGPRDYVFPVHLSTEHLFGRLRRNRWLPM